MQTMTKCGAHQTTRQQNRKHNASSDDSLIKLKRSHLSFSKITFSAKPWLCICRCTSKKKRLLMLFLAEDSTDIFVSGWTPLWKNDESFTWIDYWPCSLNNTKNELKQAGERDWKSGLIVEFPIIILAVQIIALTQHIRYWAKTRT